MCFPNIHGATGPIGPADPTGPEVITAFGGLYNDGPEIIPLTASSPAVLPLPVIMPNANITPGVNNITINTAGNYQVSFTVVLQSTATAGLGLNVGVQVNGSFSVPALVSNIITDTDHRALTVSVIAALAVEDVLDLAILSPDDTSITLVPNLNASLSVWRISD